LAIEKRKINIFSVLWSLQLPLATFSSSCGYTVFQYREFINSYDVHKGDLSSGVLQLWGD